MIRIAVSGVGGKLAGPIIEAISAADDLDLAGLYNPNRSGQAVQGTVITGDPSAISADVVIETAHPDVVFDNLAAWSSQGMAAVVGTSGFTPERLSRLREMWGTDLPCLVVPNFSVGAVLMMRFAAEAAPHFEGSRGHRTPSLNQA